MSLSSSSSTTTTVLSPSSSLSLPSSLPLSASTVSTASSSASLQLPAANSFMATCVHPPPGRCAACGRCEDGQRLHRVMHDGMFRHHCTRCILFSYKTMYCSLCFEIYSDPSQLGDPSLWLTCSKCQRFSHWECANDRGVTTDSVFFTCHDCSKPRGSGQSPSNANVAAAILREEGSAVKKVKYSYDSQQSSAACSDEETLIAARIVAILAVKAAEEAKKNAATLAAAAAKAAVRAQVALDAVHKAEQEGARWRLESQKLFPPPKTVQPARSAPSFGATRARAVLPKHFNDEDLLRHPNIIAGAGSRRITADCHGKTNGTPVASEALLKENCAGSKEEHNQLKSSSDNDQDMPSPLKEIAGTCSDGVPFVKSATCSETVLNSSATLPVAADAVLPFHGNVLSNASPTLDESLIEDVSVSALASDTGVLCSSLKEESEHASQLALSESLMEDGSASALPSDSGVLCPGLNEASEQASQLAFSIVIEDEVVDDFVDIGALLPEESEEREIIGNQYVMLEGDSAHPAGSGGMEVDDGIELPENVDLARFRALFQHSPASDSSSCSEDVMMTVSDDDNKPLTYSVMNSIYSATLQTATLTDAQTGQIA